MAIRLENERRAGGRLHTWRRGGSLACQEVSDTLAEMADGSTAPPAVISHVEYCLSCQAELARYHKLLRLLHQLRTTEVALPEGIVADVLTSLEGAAARSAVRSILTGRRVAYVGTVLAAGGAAAGLVMLARARRGRLTPSPNEAN